MSVNNNMSYAIGLRFIFLSLILMGVFSSCRYESLPQPSNANTGYPDEIANIITTKCANTGCHNSASADNAAGIDLSSWEKIFTTGRSGSCVIPFSPEYSYMLYTVNTDSTKGPVLIPTMPYNASPLSSSEYEILKAWISAGAPNKEGELKYPLDPFRKKIYVCMQGCDQVAVIDSKTKNIMKYVKVGTLDGTIEAPHQVRISPDGQYWYVVFYSGTVLQKFRATDDSLVGSAAIGNGQWNTVMISPDGTKAFVNGTDISQTKVVDLNSMSVITTITIDFPHGGFITPDGHFLYLTTQNGNFINKIDLTDPFYSSETIVLQPGEGATTASRYDPHEMILSQDGTKYFISCQKSNEVRIFNSSNDSLITVVPVGTKPQEFGVASQRPYIYITCTEDPVSANSKGRVYVLNSQTGAVITSLYAGYQPHGIAVDDNEDIVYVANLNLDTNGPAPHHVSDCGGRNGYLTCIDQKTLQLLQLTSEQGNQFQYKLEVLRAPYFISYRN